MDDPHFPQTHSDARALVVGVVVAAEGAVEAVVTCVAGVEKLLVRLESAAACAVRLVAAAW